MTGTRIAAIRTTPVAVRLEAPLRHGNGTHWVRFVLTAVEVESRDGCVGLDEMGGGGAQVANHDWDDPAAARRPALR